jgi:hypothetical protein
MALVSLPSTVSEKFAFSVRDDAVAARLLHRPTRRWSS